ncbi:restriction endonuclease subunit S [Clostridium sp. JS66]|uniref:restriction endonuclease subunit S n=1 Tax=Clostridium sp. JS66 TaxID=3064705 RepID=UPI00298E92BD|nr:restriction endonuclease subunit S [Clostridium sp. JS66]WPC42815.1 restriction endonuclease subunit S [Clostridium sp. JS66]
MVKYKKYEKYKDSGIECIGEIPNNWQIKKLKYMTRFIGSGKTPRGGAEIYSDEGVIFIRSQNVYDDGLRLDDVVYINEDINNEMKSTMVKSNDVLLNITGASIGRTSLVPNGFPKANVNQHVCIIRPNLNNIIPSMLAKIISSEFIKNQILMNQNGSSREGLNFSQIGNLDIILPKQQEEQARIAKFLDKKISEIDSLIAYKEKLITSLEEKRQAIITEAVTKGLNSNVSMKDSGVEWIGEIPEQWNLSKIKYQTNINIKTLSENTDEDYDIKYIDISSVNSNGEIINIENYTFKNSPSRARRILSKGDTIVSTVRTYLKAITWFEDVEENLICSTGFTVLSPKNTIYPKYLFYLMRSTRYIDEIVRRSTGVSYPAITSSEIGKIECLLPNMKEQIKIVKYIDEQIGEISDLVESTVLQIEKLKEYRQSLISEAVTGKIDVRDYYKEA